MYTIIVYDVGIERVNKVKAFLRQYMTWMQNSVFEGELTDAEFMKVKKGIENIIDEDYDSVLIYTIRDKKWLNSQILGIQKGSTDNII